MFTGTGDGHSASVGGPGSGGQEEDTELDDGARQLSHCRGGNAKGLCSVSAHTRIRSYT